MTGPNLTNKRFESQVIPIVGGRIVAPQQVTAEIDLPTLDTRQVRAFMVNSTGVVDITLAEGDEINGLTVVQGVIYPFYITKFRAVSTSGRASGIFVFY